MELPAWTQFLRRLTGRTYGATNRRARTAHRWHPSARPARLNSGDPSVRFAELCQEFAFVRPASLRRGCMRLSLRLHATIVWRVLASLRTGYLLKETGGCEGAESATASERPRTSPLGRFFFCCLSHPRGQRQSTSCSRNERTRGCESLRADLAIAPAR